MRIILFLSFIILFSSNCYAQTAEDYNKRAYEKASSGKHSEAVVEFTKAIELLPSHDVLKAIMYYGRARERYILKDYKGAIFDHTRAIEISPNYTGAYTERADCKEVLHEYEGAINDYTKAIELDKLVINMTGSKSSLASYYFHRGMLKLKTHAKDSGCADLRRAGELDGTIDY